MAEVETKTKETPDFKEMVEKTSDLAKNIWLAGLGAYAKAMDGAQDQYGILTGKVKEAEEKAEKTTVTLFEDLVSKGKKIEETSQVKFTEAKEKATTSLEERLTQVKSNISGLPKLATGKKSEQLDEISEKLDTILAAISKDAAPAKKTSAKKVAAEASA